MTNGRQIKIHMEAENVMVDGFQSAFRDSPPRSARFMISTM